MMEGEPPVVRRNSTVSRQDERTQMARQHIFVVNGSPEFLDIVRELLQEERYNVTTTNYVPETFALIEALNPALVILDLAVGFHAGWDLLEQLASEVRLHAIPTVVMSIESRYLNAVQADPARYDAQRVLQKPFNLDDLLRAVQELIGPA
jgi:CheY-like chemotaxis protein